MVKLGFSLVEVLTYVSVKTCGRLNLHVPIIEWYANENIMPWHGDYNKSSRAGLETTNRNRTRLLKKHIIIVMIYSFTEIGSASSL
jgi:hypothetical protein